MDISSNFSERLKELMFDKGVSSSQLAESIFIKSNAITRYLQGVRLPRFETLVLLADYFHCSIEFLLGRSEETDFEKTFLPAAPFGERLQEVLQECGVSKYALKKKTNISWNNFHKWSKGEQKPYPDSLIKIADALEISIDYLLGRVK